MFRYFILVALLLFSFASVSYAAEGDVVPPTLPAYGKPGSFSIFTGSAQIAEISGLFTSDWSNFMSNMSSTPLFSLVPSATSLDFSSSDPVISFDFGMYGVQAVDFSTWPPSVMLILRSIILCSASWYAINIALRG